MVPSRQADISSQSLTEEDLLDWRENQTRSRADCERVDRNFTMGWMALVGLWAVILTVGGGSLGVIAMLGYFVFTHHAAGI